MSAGDSSLVRDAAGTAARLPDSAGAAAVSTAGIDWPGRSGGLRSAVELLSSMRFSISLLTVICIASVTGTVVKQHEPAINYVNQFGPFWSAVFTAVGLTSVYSAWWFLLILAFLVVSTSLCIARNAPKIAADLRNYKEHVREQALVAFHLHARGEVAEAPRAAYDRIAALLAAAGWKARVERRAAVAGSGTSASRGTMIAARRGAANKIGYLAAHSAIVLICIGGLFDGDLIVRALAAVQGKSSYGGGGLIRDVAPEHRLGPGTPTFRANLLVPEGGRAGVAIINQADGVVLQELPFDIELKKFIVEYYETGMPKLFASEVVIHDRDTGEALPATIKVNQPAFHRGVAIYQSSFDDGGSRLKLRALPMAAGAAPFELQGTVGESGPLALQRAAAEPRGDGERLTLELTGLRVINVENFAAGAKTPGQAASAGGLAAAFERQLGSGARERSADGTTAKTLRNVGPSFSYKLRDASGQAREYNNYMLPVDLDGQRVFLAGVRDTPADAFRYLRIPADDAASTDGWFRLRTALLDPARRARAAARYARQATPADRPAMAPQLEATALRVLALFAGAEPAAAPRRPDGEAPLPGAAAASSAAAGEGRGAAAAAVGTDGVRRGGLQALSDFIEGSVPQEERARISDVLLRILDGSLFELLNQSRADAGLKPLAPSEPTQAFMTQAVLSLSDSFFYPAPVLLSLTDFKQVQASVFQVARAPGRLLVYLGCALLIVGVFTMLYVRERRLWIWLEPAHGAPVAAATRITMALSSTRTTLDTDAEFDRLKRAILQDPATPP